MIFYFKAHASSAPVSVSSRAPPRLNWMWSHFSSKQKKTTQSLLRFQWKKQQQQTSRLKRFCANVIIVFVYSSFKLNGLAACISWVTLNNQYLGLQIGILGKNVSITEGTNWYFIVFIGQTNWPQLILPPFTTWGGTTTLHNVHGWQYAHEFNMKTSNVHLIKGQ